MGLEPEQGGPHRTRSEASSWDGGRSAGGASRASSSAAGLPPSVSPLVKRCVSVSRGEFARLEGLEAASWRPTGRTCCSKRAPACCCLPVLRPSSRFYAWWSLLMLFCDLTYTAILCPVSVAFAPRDSLVSWAFVVDFIAGLLFTVDVFLNFHVGFVIQHGMHQRTVMSRLGVARLYCLRGTFIVDLLSSLAWFAQCAVLVLAWAGSDPYANLSLAHILRIARMLRILRVLRLLKKLYLSQISHGRRLLGLRPHTLHVLQLFYVAGVIFNFCGCCWWLTAREQSGFEGSWVTHYNAFIYRYSPDGASAPTAAQAAAIPSTEAWLASAYWASTTILTVGYGDIVPATPLETVVCMLVQLGGICFFGALLSSISSIIQRASKAARRGAALEEKLEAVQRYMEGRKVPREVRRRIKRYYADDWVQRQDELDVQGFYSELPHSLRTDLAWSVASPSLSSLRCFRPLLGSQAACRALASRLEPLELPPGFTLCEQGEEAAACWVLQEGQACVVTLRELDEQEEEEVVEGPALLGEEALLGAALGHPCHRGTLRTLSGCKLWRLEGAAFAAALRAQPQALQAVRAVLLHGSGGPAGRCTSTSEDGGSRGRLEGGGSSGEAPVQVFVDARSRSVSQTAESLGAAAATAPAAAGRAPEGQQEGRASPLRQGGGNGSLITL